MAECEVIIVGAGPAGISCGYVLAKAGVDVVILERGRFAGSKNMFGGIFFADQMNKLIPDFYIDAPVERFVAKKHYSLLINDSEVSLNIDSEEHKKPPYNHSYIVRRSVFDKWFAEKAKEQGATIICGTAVTDFVWDGNKVVGVKAGTSDDPENVLTGDVVVCGEGANSMLSEKAGLRNRLSMRARCISVKEVIQLGKDVIDERFGLTAREGAAYEYFADATPGMLGDGFIYTNMDSLSVGVGVVISEMYGAGNSACPNELLDRFKSHPCIRPLVKGGKTLEYSAHMIPMDGYKNLPRFYTDGLMLVGDAAGFVNNSICHEGVNMAMASGIMAAETILENRGRRRYDAGALRQYERRLNNSFVLENMKSSRDFIDILRTHKELLNDYPHLIKDVITTYFEVSDVPKSSLKRDVIRMVRGRISFVKAARTFAAILKGGI
ncbi:MAG TPA: FAD-dependent oxidoreductase [Planctomycetes bacterium]|nr:FAD-dependent oxidoreductase [Planctomycetota bacterium]HIJ70340.1 FAD-dependent oxidoreductase [Planctomycetota bacterium]